MRARLLLAIASLLSLPTACDPTPEAPPHVLLVTVDTLRPDHLSAYGHSKHETPGSGRLAREGALFENAFTDTPWTTPSMATVMTGVYPTRHGFKSTNTNRLDLAQHTLAEILGEHGYATAAVVGSFPLDSVYQLDQGFEHYDDEFTTPIWVHPDVQFEHRESRFLEDPEQQAMFVMSKAMSDSRRSDAEVTEAALTWLRARPDRPFFLWVHYFGPHSKPDWRIPEDDRLERQLSAYGPDVLENDRELVRLLDALDREGLTQDTLVLFHADHGESLGEQGYLGHGSLLNAATMRIPLLLRWPGRIEAGIRVEPLARNVDLLPTILEAAGVPAPPELQGESLLPRVRPGAPTDEVRRVAYMETYYPAHGAFATPVTLEDGSEIRVGTIRRGVTDGRFLLVRSEAHPMLDANDEPWETLPSSARDAVRDETLTDLHTHRVVARDSAVARELRAALDAQIALERGEGPRLEVNPDDRLRLKSLGYDR